jgi:hypothetical protein
MILNDAIWQGMTKAEGWKTGAKKKGQCNGCDNCSPASDFTDDKNVTCGDCHDDNWFQYPCFLGPACTCGGGPGGGGHGPSDGPSEGPSTGPEDMFDDGAFDFVALV